MTLSGLEGFHPLYIFCPCGTLASVRFFRLRCLSGQQADEASTQATPRRVRGSAAETTHPEMGGRSRRFLAELTR